MTARAFCAEVSQENSEPLFATASRVEHWLLVEYRGLWPRRPLAGSLLSERVKQHLTEQVEALGRSRLLFIRRPERRLEPALRCYAASAQPGRERLSMLEVASHEELAEIDFAAGLADGGPGTALEHPLLVVCTHGKRDRCCARYGRPLYEELRDLAEPDWVWQSTHVGGDRFAGNVVCLPQGLCFGRVGRADVGALLDHHLAGEIHLDRYRGRSFYSFAAQAAEQAVRVETGSTGIDDLELVSSERAAEGWRVRFRVRPRGEVREVDVAVAHGDLAYLTCEATTLRRPRLFLATAQRVLPLR
jgi:hypothetical protein